ncbi:MAG: hypothetical protein FWC57_01380 [Endomicrobia bacterium]|nr:hypothetical protein [Endomicrobiia bacterium]
MKVKTDVKTARICAIIALAATVLYIPLNNFITPSIVKFSAMLFPSTSHFSIYALFFAIFPTILYYFGMLGLLAYVVIFLYKHKAPKEAKKHK